MTPTGPELAIAERIAHAREPLLVRGAGTKSGMLRPVQAAATLTTEGLTGITLYAPKELIISALAGTPLHKIEAALADHGQHLIAEPPDLSVLLGTRENIQTLGGIVATNLSGPRRVAWGAMRDHVMGVRAVTGRAEIIHSGGRVLKNVTGLDLCKLLTGSHGTLGVITEITLKVLPAPEAAGTSSSPASTRTPPSRRCRRVWAPRTACQGRRGCRPMPPRACRSHCSRPLGRAVAHEDFAASVAYRTEKLRGELGLAGAEIVDDAASRTLWRAVRDARVLPAADGDGIWRVSVRPSAGPGGCGRTGRRRISTGAAGWSARRTRDGNDPSRDRGRGAPPAAPGL